MSSATHFISQLNNDCLHLIFSFLPLREQIRLERVCKRWQEVSCSRWLRLTELKLSELVNKEGLLCWQGLEKALQFSGPRLTTVDLLGVETQIKRRNYCILTVISETCPGLQVLKSEFLVANTANIQSLADNCKMLKHVGLRNCSGLKDVHVEYILEHCKHLEVLDLSYCLAIDGNFAKHLTPTTHTLYLDGCSLRIHMFSRHRDDHNITKLSLKYMKAYPNFISFLNCFSKTLQHLILSGKNSVTFGQMSILSQLKSLTFIKWDHFFAMLERFDLFVARCTLLEELNLFSCYAVHYWQGPNLMMSLADLPCLRVLRLHNTGWVSDNFLQALVASNKVLSIIECTNNRNITDEGAFSVLRCCPLLELLDLGGCEQITSQVLIVAECEVIKRSDTLPLTLVLAGTNVTQQDVEQHVTEPRLSVKIVQQL